MNEFVTKISQTWDESPLNYLRLGILITVLSVVFLLSGIPVTYPGWILLVFNVLIVNFVLYGILLLGLNLQYGYAGIVNFGPVLFFALGAYTVALVSAESTFTDIGMGLPWYVGVAAAIVVTLVVAFILSLSTIQLRGDYLAVVTLAGAEIFHQMTMGLSATLGGSQGIPGIPRIFHEIAPDAFTAGFAAFSALSGLLIVSYAVMQRLGESPFGRILRGIRDDETAVEFLGKDIFSYKVKTFLIGSVLMGVAGAFLGLINGGVSPGFITIDVTVLVWVGMLIGGAGSNKGALVGLLIISSFQLFTRFANQSVPVDSQTFASLRLMAVGLLMILIIVYRPQGIFGDPEKLNVEA
ncbi:branched-chain amino acid ABC transporter permease [Natrinema gelatinilyticum]|uniref:branched-chain amino acid ABC transporter permease n=1 Tax=Natrinema gelatinilyticum TaxID=2961571 RepID=UPI0020C34E67|nr:branched-chain amino acid ABC transporter permease [Natrinema gelatinilyticum]